MSEAAVLSANDAFYDAMRRGDLSAMDRLWVRRRPVSCTHPSGPQILGRAAVMESWRLILEEGVPPAIRAEDARAVVTGGAALVLCREQIGPVSLMASNSFVLEDGAWRMLTHQAAPMPR